MLITLAPRIHFAVFWLLRYLCGTYLLMSPEIQSTKRLISIKTLMVGVRGFEPPAPASRKQCSTRLSYTPPTEREL